ncbi:hypothetical protein O181_085127 [Austropuccinia psidii MF-1]|uniref:Uncharacterized protein n=1 Tax=Austropuccinia psidii MF-1 TaxID=1389203 RepID=A0A9Q3ILG5_9BASI|nr:hypothetical protein [Austropuccinia psidii MF-1]
MSCLCVHDVFHPCTHNRGIVQWAPTMSPAYAEPIYGYTSFGLGVLVTHTHPHMQYFVAGSTSVIHKMIIPQRQSPFMDDLVKSTPQPLHQDWQKDLLDVCVQTGGSCAIFINLWMVAGQSGGAECESKAQGNQYWWLSEYQVQSPTIDARFALVPVDTLNKDLVDINPTASSLKFFLDKVRHHVKQSTNDAFEYAKQKWDKSHKNPEFKLGDLILVSTLNFNNIKGPKKFSVNS